MITDNQLKCYAYDPHNVTHAVNGQKLTGFSPREKVQIFTEGEGNSAIFICLQASSTWVPFFKENIGEVVEFSTKYLPKNPDACFDYGKNLDFCTKAVVKSWSLSFSDEVPTFAVSLETKAGAEND